MVSGHIVVRKSMGFRYLKDVVTLELFGEKCNGCGMCAQVCVHDVFVLIGGVAQVLDKDGCMECGACALNCPADALTVSSGVGCAWAIFFEWFKNKRAPAC